MNISVLPREDKRRQSQSEDGRGVQGVIRLVAAAAAAAVSDPARLRGVRLLLASLVRWSSMGWAGGAGVHRSWGVGEHHARSEGRGRGRGRQHRGVERLWVEGNSRDGRCHRLAWDGDLRFGLLHLCWSFGWGSMCRQVLRLQFDASQRGNWWMRVWIRIRVLYFTDGTVGLQDQLQLVSLLL